MMQQSSRHVLQFESVLKNVGESFQNFDWENDKRYGAWLAQTYFYVKHTTTMITLAAARYGVKDSQRFGQMLKHLSEERGHDLLLLKDLRELGLDINQYEEATSTSLFHQNQYYMIQNEGPTAHLGYALLLEAMCAQYGPSVYERVVKRYGKHAATFLKVHVIADQAHSEGGLKELLSLDEATSNTVLVNVRQSAFLYQQILRDCVAPSPKSAPFNEVA